MAVKARIGLASASLPLRLDYDAATAAISTQLFPISRRKVQRMLSSLPRVYVGRTPLFDTELVLNTARQILSDAPLEAANLPRRRSHQAPP
jgi:hypothetical protein